MNEIAKRQIRDMKHAIGCNSINVKSSDRRRNYNLWDKLVFNGYATKRVLFNEVVYQLTEKGVRYLEEGLSGRIIQNQ